MCTATVSYSLLVMLCSQWWQALMQGTQQRQGPHRQAGSVLLNVTLRPRRALSTVLPGSRVCGWRVRHQSALAAGKECLYQSDE